MTREDNPTQTTPQSERRVNWAEMRQLVAKSDFWRPDTIPTKLRILEADGLRAGSNKWGRIQIYAKAQLEDGRIVKLAMSRRCAAGLIELLDAEGFDQSHDLSVPILEVKKTGRGLDTGYAWSISELEPEAMRRAAVELRAELETVAPTAASREAPSGKASEARSEAPGKL